MFGLGGFAAAVGCSVAQGTCVAICGATATAICAGAVHSVTEFYLGRVKFVWCSMTRLLGIHHK